VGNILKCKVELDYWLVLGPWFWECPTLGLYPTLRYSDAKLVQKLWGARHLIYCRDNKKIVWWFFWKDYPLSQSTYAKLGSSFLGVRKKKEAKKDKDRPRCSCEQLNQPKGHRSMEVQGANRRDKNFREPSVNPTWEFQLRLVSGGCGLTA